MVENIQSKIILNNGVKMPYLGLGVYKAEEGQEVINAVQTAVKTGYRAIDTATLYENEEGVGQAVRMCGVPREEIFVTTKVWNDDQGYDNTLRAFESSRKKLGLDVIDLYLIHWPIEGKYKDTWRALEKLYEEGRVRAIGVSNFEVHHLEDLLADCKIKPVINQIECHPKLTRQPLRDFCQQHDIAVEAWRPLTRGEVFEHETIQSISKKYNKTPAQVILRWHLQNGMLVIPKSTNDERIKENANLFDFQLAADDIEKINQIDQNKRYGPTPEDMNQ